MSKLPHRKHVVITGCSRGLGRALVERFYEKGWTVSGCARNVTQINELQATAKHQSNFSSVDISNWSSVQSWADQVLAQTGAPDLILNNAAVINPNAPLWKVEPDTFADLTAININGVFYVCKAFLPTMIERGSGVIANFSSGWGRSTSPEVAPYCASKFAIEGMTRALAQELPHGMAAIPLSPGVVNTDMLQSCFADGAAQYPSAEEWSKLVIDDLLFLNAEHNGISLTVPLEHDWEQGWDEDML
jgi:NAD(P)-dependent dehydrogenase (short-subunit alcohol dehydrogenase family)